MKVLLAAYGSRGDVEPCAAAGRELMRRGHEVTMAVPPNMRGFVESAGLAAVAYGRDTRERIDAAANFVRHVDNPLGALPQVMEQVLQVSAEKSATLTSLAAGTDLLVTGMNEQKLAANVAEYHDIPLAALHFFPAELLPTGGLLSTVTTQAEAAQREALGLPEATEAQKDRAPLEIQGYDEILVPGLAAGWGEAAGRRPFVGALTLELPAEADDEVLSWIAADTLAVVSAACAQLGERALICSGPNDFTGISPDEHVKIVDAVNHAAIFPDCRALIHHGGAGTTAAGMRAGVPTLVVWLWLDQPMWAEAVVRLKVGSARAFSESTLDSVVSDLRSILTPQCLSRCQQVAGQLTSPVKSVAHAADLLEDLVDR
jgi:vancomycin aglycone glucosyltransferase